MQTSTILTSLGSQTSGVKTNRAASAAPTETSFSQHLNKEISNKKNTGTARGDMQARIAETNSSAASEPAEGGKVASEEKEEVKESAAPLDNADAGASAGTQLLALVSNLAQFATAATSAATPGQAANITTPAETAMTLSTVPLNDAADVPKSAPTTVDDVAGEKISAFNPARPDLTSSRADRQLPSDGELKPIADADEVAKQLSPPIQDQNSPDAVADQNTLNPKDQLVATLKAGERQQKSPVLAEQANLAQAQRVDIHASIAEKLGEQQAAVKLSESDRDLAVVPPATPNPAQQLNPTTPATANTIAQEHIMPRVGSSGWDKAVAQKLVWMVGGALQSAELTLNPPDLGPLQVVLNVSNDQANATFISAQPEVREALESALPRLRQMMSDAGVQLTGFSVHAQTSGQGRSYADQRQNERHDARVGGDSPQEGRPPTTAVNAGVSTQLGMVDTFV
ncbi:MAG: flagellar hook-length control protein FliK [Burkholderiales bacterium]|nr:flagellar hook-length control protein FliK [Burkholderiales bacterium]